MLEVRVALGHCNFSPVQWDLTKLTPIVLCTFNRNPLLPFDMFVDTFFLCEILINFVSSRAAQPSPRACRAPLPKRLSASHGG